MFLYIHIKLQLSSHTTMHKLSYLTEQHKMSINEKIYGNKQFTHLPFNARKKRRTDNIHIRCSTSKI